MNSRAFIRSGAVGKVASHVRASAYGLPHFGQCASEPGTRCIAVSSGDNVTSTDGRRSGAAQNWLPSYRPGVRPKRAR